MIKLKDKLNLVLALPNEKEIIVGFELDGNSGLSFFITKPCGDTISQKINLGQEARKIEVWAFDEE